MNGNLCLSLFILSVVFIVVCEADNLRNILDDKVNYAEHAVQGVKKTTTLHKICSRLRKHSRHTHHKENNKRRSIKHTCGVLYGYDEQYNKQSNKVADIIQNSHKSATSLKKQKEKLIQEVNKLAKLSGPLPKLRLAG